MAKQHHYHFLLFGICLLFLQVNSQMRYCEVQTSELKLFLTQKELQQIPLNNHIRGYNLDFESTNQTLVDIFEPYHLAEESTVEFKTGYDIINVDNKNSENNVFGRQGIIFAHDSDQGISIAYAQYQNHLLPNISKYNYYELPVPSYCYNALIINPQLDVVIDCSAKDFSKDYSCVATQAGQITCSSLDSITYSHLRKSIMISTSPSNYFLLTAALTDYINPEFKNETYVTVYHIVNGKSVFNFIIDRRTLQIPSLSITDIDIIVKSGIKYILLTDRYWGLITFRYLQSNKIEEVNVMKVETPSTQSVVTADGSIFVANNKFINHYGSDLGLVGQYQLDISDSNIIDLLVSPGLIVARSSSQHIYTYSMEYKQLKYLLSKDLITKDTAVVLSPFFPRIFHIHSDSMKSIAITSGYLFVSDSGEGSTVQVKAHSGNLTCTINILIQVIDSTKKIYQKKEINSTGYRFSGNSELKFVLTDYYGGSRLKYNLKGAKQPGITYKIKHINNYNLPKLPSLQLQDNNGNLQKVEDKTAQQTIYLREIIEIDEESYYLATFSDLFYRFFLCKRSLQDATIPISCKEVSDQIPAQNASKVTITAGKKKESNGNYLVTWVTDTQVIGYKVFGVKGYTLIWHGSPRYSGIKIGQKYTVYIQKQLNIINFYDGRVLNSISKSSFSTSDLAKLGQGFYPRDVYVNPTNPNIFYIKLPIAIATVVYYGVQDIQIIAINPIRDSFIPDSQWTLVVGNSHLLLFTPEGISQYTILPDSSIQFLHSIQLGDKKPSIPYEVGYQSSTNTAHFLTDDGSIEYIRLNQPKTQSVYYVIQGSATQNDNSKGLTISGSWSLLPGKNQVYYLYRQPTFNIISNMDDNTNISEFKLDLIVSSNDSSQQIIETQTKIVTVNYKTDISSAQGQNTAVTLPSIGNNSQILFPVQNYFNGTISNYVITCPFSAPETLKLLPPFRLVGQNDGVTNLQDIVPIPGNLGVIILQDNTLSVVSVKNKIESTIAISGTQGECKKIGIQGQDLVVFCSSNGIQQIFLFALKEKTLLFSKHLYLSDDAFISYAYQIGLHRIDTDNLYILIQDTQQASLISKNSNVKMLKASGDELTYVQTLDSTDFFTSSIESIESLAIWQQHLLVTIGNTGFGYLNLNKYPDEKSLIKLNDQPELVKHTLDNSVFQRVKIVKIDTNKTTIQVFITTSNALSFLVQLSIGETSVVFSKVLERYNRYGSQQSVNWAIVDQKIIVLSYYNSSTSVQSLALYRRPKQQTTSVINFFYAKQFTIPSSQVHPPKSTLLYISTIQQTSNLLFIENGQKPSASASLSLFNVTGQFHLLASYNQTGNFNTIKVTAQNALGKKVSRDIDVIFDNDASGGLKWYAVVITICLVLLVIGIAVGLYMRMKARKGDSKKVSLYTEDQQTTQKV